MRGGAGEREGGREGDIVCVFFAVHYGTYPNPRACAHIHTYTHAHRYFFIEIFDHFKAFFLFVFQVVCICAQFTDLLASS